MILNTLVKTVKRKSHRGNQAVTTDLITQDIIACVNEAARELARLIPKRYWWAQSSFDTIIGTTGVPAVYSLDPAVQEPIAFYYVANGSVLYTMAKIDSDHEWLRGIWNPIMPPNFPRLFRQIGPDADNNKQIEIFPVANAIYTVKYEYYKIRHADLTVDDLASEVPNFPDWVQDAIEKGALYLFLKGFDDAGLLGAKTDYEEAKMALEISDEQNKDSDIRIRLFTPNYNMPGFTLD